MQKGKKKKNNHDGLWTPNVIMNIPGLDASCKLLLAHFYSLGTKGCYQSNKTLAEIFMTSGRTICNRISKLYKYLYIKCPKGYYRTIWVKIHPQVSEVMKKRFNNQQQGCERPFVLTTKNQVVRLRKMMYLDYERSFLLLIHILIQRLIKRQQPTCLCLPVGRQVGCSSKETTF